MSYVTFDKENVTNSARKFGDSVKSAQLLSTPQHKMRLKDSKGITNTEKRRALGEILNSTRSSQAFCPNTPKASLNSKFGTPIIKSQCMKKLTQDFDRQSLAPVSVKSEQSVESKESYLPVNAKPVSAISEQSVESKESYPPVENRDTTVDTFNDLFEDGKISDLFIKRRMTYLPRLPTGKERDVSMDGEKLQVYDTDVDKSLKEVNRLIKNELKKESKACLETYHEIEALELPPILEDFDLSGEEGDEFGQL